MAGANGLKRRLGQRPPLVVCELLLTALSVLSLLLVGVLMTLTQVWSDQRWVKWKQSDLTVAPSAGSQHARADAVLHAKPLSDVVLDNLPVTWYQHTADALVGAALIIGIVGCCAMARGWQARLVYIRRTMWMASALYLIRSITIGVTTMPPTVDGCKPRVVRDVADLMLEVLPKMTSGEISACTDKIFSGHTAMFVLTFLMWSRYARHWGLVVFSGIHSTIGIASVMLTRMHYTVDVVLAILMVLLVHHTYFVSLEAAIRERNMTGGCQGGYNLIASGDTDRSRQATVEIFLAEDAEKGIGMPADCLTGTTAHFPAPAPAPAVIDTAVLLTNRKPYNCLPTIVAWLDGLWLREPAQ
ncbi:hypothetical protein H4R19_000859 [Coemansia spiralis]|nr:hypothetical protein H4R19_000859 [Coemansia spiralis]